MLCNCRTWKTGITCQNSFFKIAIKIKSTCPPEIVLPASFTFYGLGRQGNCLRGRRGGRGGPQLLKMTEKLPEPFGSPRLHRSDFRWFNRAGLASPLFGNILVTSHLCAVQAPKR